MAWRAASVRSCVRRATNNASGLLRNASTRSFTNVANAASISLLVLAVTILMSRPKGGGCRPHFPDEGVADEGVIGIDERGKARGSRQQLVQQPEPFARKLDADVAYSGRVAARPVQAGSKANFHRVGPDREDNGNRRGRPSAQRYSIATF